MQSFFSNSGEATFHGDNAVKKFEMRKRQAGGMGALSVAIYPAPVNQRCLDIYQGDPLFEFLSDKTDDVPEMESALNGILVPRAGDMALQMGMLRENIVFRGFAVSPVKYEGNSTGVPVAQLSGICTVMNTGMHRIEVGDAVVWQLPSPDRVQPQCTRRGSNFRTLELVPLHRMAPLELSEPNLYDNHPAIRALVDAGVTLQNLKREVGLKACILLATTQLGNVVGVAQSSADAGEAFDIMITPCFKQQAYGRLRN